jgi:hypothetical protein
MNSDAPEKYRVSVPLVATHRVTDKITGTLSDIEIVLGTSIHK